ncbi:hypothetical protein TNCV_1794701 [Trichonephila clavipes]|nr:hypothetical protein TNCV_1794701 [Trichonephila clavipes]
MGVVIYPWTESDSPLPAPSPSELGGEERKRKVNMKSLVYKVPVPSVEGNARMAVAIESIRDMPGIFQNKRNST